MISGRRLFGRSHLLTFRSKQHQQSSFDTQQIDLITRWIVEYTKIKRYFAFLYGPYYIYWSSGLGGGPSRPMRRPATVTVTRGQPAETSPIPPAATTGSRFKVFSCGPGPRQAAGGVMPGLGTCLGAPLRIPGP